MQIGSERWNRLLVDGAKDFGIHLENRTLTQFAIFAEELILWNTKTNLTAITDSEEIAIKHFLDSIVPSIYMKPDTSVIDIGSGGGFPGIPLSILFPSLRVTLIDASRKKVSFLKHIIRKLKLIHTDVRQIRAEYCASEIEFAGMFDVVISRALYPVEKLMAIGLPLISEHAQIISMKGKDIDKTRMMSEVREQLETWKTEESTRQCDCFVKRYCLKQIDAQRSMVIFQFRSSG